MNNFTNDIFYEKMKHLEYNEIFVYFEICKHWNKLKEYKNIKNLIIFKKEEYLKETKEWIEYYNVESLKYASYFGKLDIVKCLLYYYKVDPSIYDNIAIQLASQNGYVKIVEILIKDSRVDPSTDDNYCLHSSSNNGHIKIVKLLLSDKRVEPIQKAINSSIKHNFKEITKLLIDKLFENIFQI